jgi:hypothetical protein
MDVVAILIMFESKVGIHLFILPKIIKDLRQLYVQADDLYHIQQRFFAISESLTLLFFIFTVCHYYACGFHYVAAVQP